MTESAAALAAPTTESVAADSPKPLGVTDILGDDPELKTDRITVNGVEVGPTTFDPVSELTFLVLPRGTSKGARLDRFKWIPAALSTSTRDGELPDNNVFQRIADRTDMNV